MRSHFITGGNNIRDWLWFGNEISFSKYTEDTFIPTNLPPTFIFDNFWISHIPQTQTGTSPYRFNRGLQVWENSTIVGVRSRPKPIFVAPNFRLLADQYYSDDGGQTWTDNGLGSQFRMFAVSTSVVIAVGRINSFDPLPPAGTDLTVRYGLGKYRISRDNGTTWGAEKTHSYFDWDTVQTLPFNNFRPSMTLGPTEFFIATSSLGSNTNIFNSGLLKVNSDDTLTITSLRGITPPPESNINVPVSAAQNPRGDLLVSVCAFTRPYTFTLGSASSVTADSYLYVRYAGSASWTRLGKTEYKSSGSPVVSGTDFGFRPRVIALSDNTFIAHGTKGAFSDAGLQPNGDRRWNWNPTSSVFTTLAPAGSLITTQSVRNTPNHAIESPLLGSQPIF